jgi:hypothetical protein
VKLAVLDPGAMVFSEGPKTTYPGLLALIGYVPGARPVIV